MSTPRQAVAAAMVCLFLCTPACKPADEPRRLESKTNAARPGAASAQQSDADHLGTIRLVAPTRPQPSEATLRPHDESTRDAVNSEDVQAPTGIEAQEAQEAAQRRARGLRLGVSEALLTAAKRAPSADAKKAAAESSRRGLAQHRKLELPAAIQAYEAALSAWPGHVTARYNLACAQALSGNKAGALVHLALLSLMDDEVADARLSAARTDPDLEGLREDPDFRALSLYAPVEVSWSPSVPDTQAAVALVDTLRRAEIPAHEGREWRKDLPETTLYVAIERPIAQRLAEELLTHLPADTKKIDSRFLNERRPIVLVLGTTNTGQVVTAPPMPSSGAIVGTRLKGTHDGTDEELYLKATGFFSWTTRSANGTRREKTGRYNLKGSALHLDFRLTTTIPGDPPTVEVEQGRRENHTIVVDDEGVLVGSTRFTR